MSLFDELKRRKVFKVGAAYLVVAWLAVQAASIGFPAFDAPPWALRILILISFLGCSGTRAQTNFNSEMKEGKQVNNQESRNAGNRERIPAINVFSCFPDSSASRKSQGIRR